MLEEITPTHIRESDQTRLCPKGTNNTDMRESTMSHAVRDPMQEHKQTKQSDNNSSPYKGFIGVSNACVAVKVVGVVEENHLSERQIRKRHWRLSGCAEQTLRSHGEGRTERERVG